MNHRENSIRAWRFQKPEWIPIASGYPGMMWDHYDHAELEDLLLTHPILFPGYQRGSSDPDNLKLPPDLYADKPYTDYWGCTWKTNFTGMVGAVVHHPLADWKDFEGYQVPDAEQTNGMYPIDWAAMKNYVHEARLKDYLVGFYLPHGHTYLRLQDLRGFENFMLDMAEEEPQLWKLIEMVEGFNLEVIQRFIDLKPDFIGIPEDLGMQTNTVISPTMFRKYIKPSYLKMTSLIKQQGIIVHEHSDGHILGIMDDLVECGGDVLNLQDLVNGIDNIQKHVKGRLAIDLDIDRQSVTVEGTPQDIDNHIREIVAKLGDVQGGLSLTYQPWPPTPIQNIKAVFDALEKYCRYYG